MSTKSLSSPVKRKQSIGRSKVDRASIVKKAKEKKFEEIFFLLLKEYIRFRRRRSSVETCQQDESNKYRMKKLTMYEKDEDDLYGFKKDTRTGEFYSTTLHEILTYQPTLEVVDLLCILTNETRFIRRESKMLNHKLCVEDTSDFHGRKPLHIAVIFGCDHSVITRLIKGSLRCCPATAVDDLGRTPLHWACCTTTAILNSRQSRSILQLGHCLMCFTKVSPNSNDHENLIMIVQVLITHCPHSASMRDCDGYTPFDLARQNKERPSIILKILNNDIKVEKTQNYDDSSHKCRSQSSSELLKSLDESGHSTLANTIEAMLRVHAPLSSKTYPLDFVVECYSDNEDADDEFDDLSSIGLNSLSRHRSCSGFRRELVSI
jgi:hypothetical protein